MLRMINHTILLNRFILSVHINRVNLLFIRITMATRKQSVVVVN